MIYKTRGIIIRRTNFGEADRIITLLSADRGKIKAIAKGIRKINSRLSGNLELFCLTNFNIAEGKNLDVVTGALIEKCYINLRNNLAATRKAEYFAEIINKTTEENDPHPEIFELFDQCLENLNTTNSDILIPYFEWNLIADIGYFPELKKCISCRKKINENEKIYFNISHGGIICENCQKGDINVLRDTIKILRLFLERKISLLNIANLDEKVIKEIKKITRLYLTSKSEKDFKAQRFVK